MSETKTMSKGERDQLRTVIRMRFKVLRSDVQARRAEMERELEKRISASFAAADKAWQDAMFLIQQAADEANRKANDILRGLNMEGLDLEGKDYVIVTARSISQPYGKRVNMRARGDAEIEAMTRKAYADLDRMEADLLTELAAGALESDAAREFLRQIPTVSDLVPASRLYSIVGIDPPREIEGGPQ